MKERLDVILMSRGYAPSREKAKELIRAGKVYVSGERAAKAGAFLEEVGICLEVRDNIQKYVGRGGLKLEKALTQWDLGLEGMTCMDIGASTGGFTDCMLQNGAAKVYAVDAGYGQLAEKLRDDERVICMERTNFRYVQGEDIGEALDFAGADVSFISLTKILPPAWNLLREGGEMVCLVKPQFEAGKGRVGKKGVVKDTRIHREVLGKIVDFADIIGFSVLHLEYSPLRGAEGNTEYLLHLRKERRETGVLSGQEAEETLDRVLAEGTGLSQTQLWGQRIEETVRRAQLAARESQEGL